MATNGNFVSKQTWEHLGSPELQKPDLQYESASKHNLPIIGTFVAKTSTQESEEAHDIKYTVSEIPELNLGLIDFLVQNWGSLERGA